MIADSGAGTARFTTAGGTGTRAKWAWTRRNGSPEPKGGAPVARSYNVAPNA